MSKPVYYLLTLGEEHVGSRWIEQDRCPTCHQRKGPIIAIGEAIGRVQPGDVGKRVYSVGGVIQVENDAQRNARYGR